MSDLEALLGQFETNPARLRELFGPIPEARLRERRLEGKWSALENLAHVARYNHAIRERVGWITGQDNPGFARYQPDADPGTAEWVAKPFGQLLSDFAADRASLAAELRALPEAAWDRPGTHAAFGTLTLAQWLAFWLQHEGHHIYTAFLRART